MITPHIVMGLYQKDVRPLLANKTIPIPVKGKLAFSYVELMTNARGKGNSAKQVDLRKDFKALVALVREVKKTKPQDLV